MTRLILALCLTLLAASLAADPGDIDAAARGVVRVVIVEKDEDGLRPIAHGSGFAVAPDRIVTNAHVIADAADSDRLRVAIVPPEGGNAVIGRIVAINARADLALIALDQSLRLPALALAGGEPPDSGEVASVGYPQNVDRAQGLSIDDIFSPQPPVKSRGFLSGMRPTREVDTVLHTASIARGNSGGPLLDGCGRVIGVNSFGAERGEADGEFFFAVSMRELLPFLRSHGVAPRINATVCRSMADLDAAEQARSSEAQAAARAAMEQRAETDRTDRDKARLAAELSLMDERDDRLVGTIVLLLLAAGLGWWAFEKRERLDAEGKRLPLPRDNRIAAAGAGAALLGALFLQVTRPGAEEVETRIAQAMNEKATEAVPRPSDRPAGSRTMVCRLDAQRSRVTTSSTEDVALEWRPNGCVNGRTQYGFSQGIWSRALVPNDDQEVSVNRLDPERGEFRTERYLLSQPDMDDAREARAGYEAPTCGTPDASAILGEQQRAVLDSLPAKPNERLVYSCASR